MMGRFLCLCAVFLCFVPALRATDPPPTAADAKPNGLLVFQSDFGVKDGAVAAMKGVALGVDANLKLHDLTHEIPAFNVWEGSYRLWQTVPYWPAGTVFVSVVDPGVGTARRSVVAHTRTGQYIVTPDNGTLTLAAEKLGLDAVREIDEATNRRAGSGASYTFHGRDVYAYTGARLAAGVIRFEEVGPTLDPAKLVSIPYERAKVSASRRTVEGGIPVLDPQYGNVWTNIGQDDLAQLRFGPVQPGQLYSVVITHLSPEYLKARAEGKPWGGGVPGEEVYWGMMVPYVHSFGDVPPGKPLLYINSLMQVSIALNMGNFAEAHHVGSGPEWKVMVSRFIVD